jgi:hypothetical protein
MSNIVIYDPDDVTVPYRVTRYKESANTPDYTGNVLINPDLSAVSGITALYWKVSAETVIPMTAGEMHLMDELEKAKTTREKLFKVVKYSLQSRVETETWYDTDNGDGTYSGKAEETTYTYLDAIMLYRIVVVYYYDGTVSSTTKYEYYKNSTTNEIIEKQKEI